MVAAPRRGARPRVVRRAISRWRRRCMAGRIGRYGTRCIRAGRINIALKDEAAAVPVTVGGCPGQMLLVDGGVPGGAGASAAQPRATGPTGDPSTLWGRSV